MKYVLLLFISSLLTEFCYCQITKVTSPVPRINKKFAIDVRLSDNNALIDEFNWESGKEGLRYSYVYQLKNGKWINTQTFYFDSGSQEYDFPEISKSKILILKRSDKNEQKTSDTLEIYEKDPEYYNKKSIIVLPFGYENVYRANFKDWIVTRGFKDLGYNSKIYRTDFYNMQENNWILIDSFFDFPTLFTDAGSQWHPSISGKYAIISDSENNDKNKYSGKVDIYGLNSNHWSRIQEIYAPDTTIQNFGFGLYTTLSPDSRFFATTTAADSGIYIYHLKNNKFEFFQHITVDGDNIGFNNIVMTNDKLFFASPEDDKHAINYYKLTNNKFEFKCRIYPPGNYTDLAIVRSYIICMSGETLLVGDPNDISQDTAFGAAYFINIPARGYVSDTICYDDSYLFGARLLNKTGIYYDTLVSSYCVDSIVRLDLTVIPNQNTTIDTVLCEGQTMQVAGQEISEAGDYSFELQNSTGCDSIIDIHLEYSEIDTSTLILSDLGCESGAINIEITGNNPPYKYKWNTGSTSENLTSIPSGNYSLIVSDKSGCIYNYDDIEVSDSIPFLIPNAFFPDDNKNEINKEFRIYLADQASENPRVKIISTKIFERWGNKVYESEGNNFWNGTKNGVPLPPEVYLYNISLVTPCGTEVKNGQVMLLR